MKNSKYKELEREKITKMIEDRENNHVDIFDNIKMIKEQEKNKIISEIKNKYPENTSSYIIEKEIKEKTGDKKPDCLLEGWIIYLFIMIAGTIFKGYIILAISATFIFLSWRHNKIEEANGRNHKDYLD